MNNASIAREIRRVLDMEAAALKGVRQAVNGNYVQAVLALSRCKGKVVLTGVGKSGLIAQKIAATFSSTGTPAAFLDPTEALHGGMGFVQKQDLVVALGKSGESDELNALIPSLRALGAKLIAITANPKSTLARAAHIVLVTPISEEACPLNLAPTSSTTAALAVGDALAVALMKVRNFGPAHFARNHPAGRLGKRLTLKVKDIMRQGESNPVVGVSESMSRLLVKMTRLQAGAAAIVDKSGKLLGLVTDYDIRKALAKDGNFLSLKIKDVMNARPTTIHENESAAQAIELMENRRNPFNVMPVVNSKKRAVGMIQVHDLRARGL